MIIGGSKKDVIANIQKYANAGLLNHKVEVNDASLSRQESADLMQNYIQLTK